LDRAIVDVEGEEVAEEDRRWTADGHHLFGRVAAVQSEF
jgi:hypothetical protein